MDCSHSSYMKELYFLVISYIALGVSFILVVAIVFNISKGIRFWSTIVRWTEQWGLTTLLMFISFTMQKDISSHLLVAMLLLLGWILFVVSVSSNAKYIIVPPEVRGAYNTFMARRSFALVIICFFCFIPRFVSYIYLYTLSYHFCFLLHNCVASARVQTQK